MSNETILTITLALNWTGVQGTIVDRLSRKLAVIKARTHGCHGFHSQRFMFEILGCAHCSEICCKNHSENDSVITNTRSLT